MLGLRPFDVQLIGGMILHEGQIAEMRTGEGKTLVAVLPAYLNALTGGCGCGAGWGRGAWGAGRRGHRWLGGAVERGGRGSQGSGGHCPWRLAPACVPYCPRGVSACSPATFLPPYPPPYSAVRNPYTRQGRARGDGERLPGAP